MRAVSRAKMANRSVYQLPGDGFAVVTALEHIYDDGTPSPKRYLKDVEAPLRWTLDDIERCLLRAPEGRYRVIALLSRIRSSSKEALAPR